MKEDDDLVPIILGRPFLSTAGALMNIRDTKLTLRVGREAITFGVDKSIKHSNNCDESVFYVDIFDACIENDVQEEVTEAWFDALLEDEEEDDDGKRDLKEGERKEVKDPYFMEEFDTERDLAELEELLEDDVENSANTETEQQVSSRPAEEYQPPASTSAQQGIFQFSAFGISCSKSDAIAVPTSFVNPFKFELEDLPADVDCAFVRKDAHKTIKEKYVLPEDVCEHSDVYWRPREEVEIYRETREWCDAWVTRRKELDVSEEALLVDDCCSNGGSILHITKAQVWGESS